MRDYQFYLCPKTLSKHCTLYNKFIYCVKCNRGFLRKKKCCRVKEALSRYLIILSLCYLVGLSSVNIDRCSAIRPALIVLFYVRGAPREIQICFFPQKSTLKGQCQATFYQKCPIMKTLMRNFFCNNIWVIMGGRYHQKYNACKMNRHKVK